MNPLLLYCVLFFTFSQGRSPFPSASRTGMQQELRFALKMLFGFFSGHH
jgi:hypothetical protein